MVHAPKKQFDFMCPNHSSYNSPLCEKYVSDVNGGKNIDFKQVQERHDRIMNKVANERKGVLKTHCCNPVIMINKGIEQAWTSCNSFHNKCNGGDYGELDKDQRVHLEWTCFHGIERQDIAFGTLSFQEWYKVCYGNALINEELIKRFQRDFDNFHLALELEKNDSSEESTHISDRETLMEKVSSAETDECSKNSSLGDHYEIDKYFMKNHMNHDKEFKGRHVSFDEWLKERFDTTKVDKETRLKVFVEWMIESYSDESKTHDEDDDPYDRSFEKFKIEFEKEVS